MEVELRLKRATKTLVQCDFDGTVTDKDVSFMLLDAFADGDWRKLLRRYQEGKITVGQFNTESFIMIKEDRQTLVEHIKDKIKVRRGFREMVDYCHSRGFRFVIVSNGQDFYIEEMLADIGMGDIEFYCAKSLFHSEGVTVQYIGPNGSPLNSDFKQAYVKLFLDDGYRIIYIGNGDSDVLPAQQCHHIFATGVLLAHCKQKNMACTPFTDFNEVVRGMEHL